MDLANLFTNLMWVVYALAFPFLMVLTLGFLTSGSYGEVITSYDYYGLTMMIYLITNAATYSANSFMEERIIKPNLRIVHSPVRSWLILFSKVAATFVFCSVTYIVAGVILHLVAGVNYGGDKTWALLLIMLLANFLFSALGVMVCTAFKQESNANQLISLLAALFAALGGLFFPVEGLGQAFVTLSWASPVKWIFVACLRIIYDGDLSVLLPTCAVLTLLSVITLLISIRLFKGEDYL